MLQNLLIDRFQIRLHHENRLFPGYDLVIAPGGPKLKLSDDPDAVDVPTFGANLDPNGFLILPPGRASATAVGSDGVHFSTRNYTIEEFARIMLSGYVRQADGSPTVNTILN